MKKWERIGDPDTKKKKKKYSRDIGMEFWIEKCVMLIIKSKKRERAERIEQRNQESIGIFGERENCK